LKRIPVQTIVGTVIVLAGVLYLLQNLGVIRGALPLMWSMLFAASGLIFLTLYFFQRNNWWALIPGMTLLGLGTLISWTEFGPRSAEDLGASFFLGFIAASFWLIFLTDRQRWWAIIPGGVLATTALMVGVETIARAPLDMGGVFFLGIGLTFALVAAVPTPEGRMKWAVIPAVILLGMGLLILAASVRWLNVLWPGLLILLGLYLLLRTFEARRKA